MGACSVSDFLPVALYSKRKIYTLLEARGIVEEDLVEYYANNVLNFRAGEFSPVVFDDLKE